MRKPKLHNRISRSTALLPTCLLLAAGLWWWPQGYYSQDHAISLAFTLLTAYVIAETNNTFQVIRVRSRMVTSVWLFAAALFGALHPYSPTTLATFCLAASYYMLFRTYQQPQAVTDIFHTFVLLAIGGIAFPPLLLLVPLYLWYLLVLMRALTLRGFFAALVGLALPFWFWGAWLLWQEDLSPLLSWAAEFGRFRLPSLHVPHIMPRHYPFLLLAALAVWTVVYYLRNSYDDKIRTRMIMYVYIIQCAAILLLAAFVPFPLQFVPLLLVSVAPLIAHYFALCNTWVAFVVFVLSFLAFLFIGILGLTPHSLSYVKIFA